MADNIRFSVLDDGSPGTSLQAQVFIESEMDTPVILNEGEWFDAEIFKLEEDGSPSAARSSKPKINRMQGYDITADSVDTRMNTIGEELTGQHLKTTTAGIGYVEGSDLPVMVSAENIGTVDIVVRVLVNYGTEIERSGRNDTVLAPGESVEAGIVPGVPFTIFTVDAAESVDISDWQNWRYDLPE